MDAGPDSSSNQRTQTNIQGLQQAADCHMKLSFGITFLP
jgi:hypothetical protein